MPAPKAAVRAGALKALHSGRAGIGAAEAHAKRLDPVSQRRRVREADPLAWSKGPGPLDYVEAFKAHKRETGASERKGADLAIEFKIVVSPSWLAETGDPRDTGNPRVMQLVEQAGLWAESWGGKGAMWAIRYDLDERGSGVVDVFMSPTREQRHKSGTSKLVISCRKAKDELLAAERQLDPTLKTSGAAMQSSWARWCQQHLDARIERGTEKVTTGREHLHADAVAQTYEEARRAAQRLAEGMAREILEEATTVAQIASEGLPAALEGSGLPEAHMRLLRAPAGSERLSRPDRALTETIRPVIEAGLSALSAPGSGSARARLQGFLQDVRTWVADLHTAADRFAAEGEVVSRTTVLARSAFGLTCTPRTLEDVLRLSPAWTALSRGAQEEADRAKTVAALVGVSAAEKRPGDPAPF